MGSVRATVDQTGAVVDYGDYDAWGYALAGRTMATQWSSLQAVAKNKFTGRERDNDFGINWDYFGARYYDAQIGKILGLAFLFYRTLNKAALTRALLSI